MLIVLGTLGYVLIEQQPLADVLYMTVITVTAVGYSEVFDLTPTGRTFTIILLLCGISWMGFWFANITSFIVELDLKDALKRRRNMQEIAKLKGMSSSAAPDGRVVRSRRRSNLFRTIT